MSGAMSRARLPALAALLLATLLTAQPATAQFNPFNLLTPQPKPAPAKPAPQAHEKKPAAAPAKPEAKKLEAKKPEANKPEAKKPEPKYTFADYSKVWDITAETTRKDIVARFGEP